MERPVSPDVLSYDRRPERREEPIALTLIGADNLARSPQRGARLVEEWSGLVRWLSHPVVTPDKASMGGFTLADLRDGVRRKTHVIGVSALGIDYDQGVATLAKAHAALARYRHVVYTTASHETNAPRWRAIIGLSRIAAIDEHALLWAHAARLLDARGIVLDRGAKDACRLWYVPTVRPGGRFEISAGEGELLDVDGVVPIARAWADYERARTVAKAPPPALAGAYARGALRRAAGTLASTVPGERHFVLNREAYALARSKLELTEAEIENALLPTFVAVAGEARRHEGQRVIRDAFRSRRPTGAR